MFDIGWTEIMVIAVVALVVIGPKDLPKAIYSIGKFVRKARGVAREFQHHVDDMMREAELDELRKQALKARDLNLTRIVEDTVDPKGTLRGAFDPPFIDGSGQAPTAGTTAATQPAPLPPADPTTALPVQPATTAAVEPPVPSVVPAAPATPAAAPPAVAAAAPDSPAAPSAAVPNPDKTA